MTIGITELPPEGMQLGGVALAGDTARGTRTTEGLSLLFTTAGITVQGPQPQIERLLVWSGLDSATCNEKIVLPDGRNAAVMELTSGGQSIRFLLPTDTVSPGQAAYLDQALPAWLARYRGGRGGRLRHRSLGDRRWRTRRRARRRRAGGQPARPTLPPAAARGVAPAAGGRRAAAAGAAGATATRASRRRHRRGREPTGHATGRLHRLRAPRPPRRLRRPPASTPSGRAASTRSGRAASTRSGRAAPLTQPHGHRHRTPAARLRRPRPPATTPTAPPPPTHTAPAATAPTPAAPPAPSQAAAPPPPTTAVPPPPPLPRADRPPRPACRSTRPAVGVRRTGTTGRRPTPGISSATRCQRDGLGQPSARRGPATARPRSGGQAHEAGCRADGCRRGSSRSRAAVGTTPRSRCPHTTLPPPPVEDGPAQSGAPRLPLAASVARQADRSSPNPDPYPDRNRCSRSTHRSRPSEPPSPRA